MFSATKTLSVREINLKLRTINPSLSQVWHGKRLGPFSPPSKLFQKNQEMFDILRLDARAHSSRRAKNQAQQIAIKPLVFTGPHFLLLTAMSESTDSNYSSSYSTPSL
jgi:hypothetical protein